ncbi:MAG: hypothetical protein ACRDSF_14750 [Pseudonocardiaceae bacterium]
MALFELGDDLATPLEVASSGGRSVVRLRRGTPVTARLVQEINELIGSDEPSCDHTQSARVRPRPRHIPAGVVVPDTVIIVLR